MNTIFMRKEDIVVETDTTEALKKLENSIEIRKKFTADEVNTAKSEIIMYDIHISITDHMFEKLIFYQIN